MEHPKMNDLGSIFRDLQLNFSNIFWNRQCLKMLQIFLYDWNAPKHTPGHFRSAGELFGPHGIEYRIWNYVEDLDEGQGNPRRLLVLQVGKWKWRNENNMLVVLYVFFFYVFLMLYDINMGYNAFSHVFFVRFPKSWCYPKSSSGHAWPNFYTMFERNPWWRLGIPHDSRNSHNIYR